MLWFETFPSLVETERRCNTTFLSVVNGCGAAFALALPLYHCILSYCTSTIGYFMAHPYGALPYGLLHRDILQIAVDHDFSKIMQRFYAWLVVNANPYSAETYGNPTVDAVSELLKISRRRLYDTRDAFVDLKLIKQEAGAHGLKCVVEHLKLARQEIKAQDALANVKDVKDVKDAIKDALEETTHPYANMIAGKIPREFVKIDTELNDGKGIGKYAQRHFWYISLNIAPGGHLTRLDEIEDIAEIIGTSSSVTMLRSFKMLQKTGLFHVKRPSTIQGQCEPIVAAMEEAAEQRQKKKEQQAYKFAMITFLQKQEKIYAEKYWQPGQRAPKPDESHVREMKKAFRRYYEETGEFLTEYF